MNHHNHRESRIRHWASCGENPTLAHFRHFSSLYFTLAHFSHLRHFRHFISLYTCRERSTNQPFLCKTNPILSAVGGFQMNVKTYNTKDYEKFLPLAGQENKPNSNPIKPNLRKAKMSANLYVIEDYRKKDDFVVRKNKPNSNPILSAVGGFQMNVNAFLQKDYENKTTFRLEQNKPNSNPIQTRFPSRNAPNALSTCLR